MCKTLTTDVLVVGGGPAGLAAAIALRLKGFKIAVADPIRPPIDKACGEGIMPEGVRALTALGVELPPRAWRPLRGIAFFNGQSRVTATFPRESGAGLRRTTLHSALARRAQQMGVVLLWGEQVRARMGAPLEIGGRRAIYDKLVGADGLNSQARKWAGLASVRRQYFVPPRRFGFRVHFQAAPWSDRVEVHWGTDSSQLFVTPVGPEEVCVALLTADPRARVLSQLGRFPEVSRRLKGAAIASAERGGTTLVRQFPVVARGQVALVGDAAGSVDAITGDGLCLSFQQSLALAAALERNDLALYQSAHDRIMRTPRRMARLLLLLGRRPAVRRRAFQILAAEPRLFSRLLGVHVSAPGQTHKLESWLGLGHKPSP